jgi:RHS repeat-associated protein
MPKASYLNLDGEVLGENREGVRRDYVADPLGSVVAELDGAGAKAAEFDYWPYGEERTASGSSGSPHRFVGSLGYHTDVPSRKVYVRARDYLPREGRWSTVDPLWPRESKYMYAAGNPVNWVDRSGRQSGFDFGTSGCEYAALRKKQFIAMAKMATLGAGRNRYYPDYLNVRNWKYGNCCGEYLYCDGQKGNYKYRNDVSRSRGRPMDCLDRACNKHDAKIPDVATWMTAKPHRELLADIKKCNCAKDWTVGSLEYRNCERAKKDMIIMFSAVVDLLTDRSDEGFQLGMDR